MSTLTRRELTAALAARQLLLERRPVAPAEAIRVLTPLQAQHPPAPYAALAARVEGFRAADLEAAITAGAVVKTTIMRMTLHLAAAGDYPAYAQLTRQPRMRTWRKQYPHLDEGQVAAELGPWLRRPRSNNEIRERVGRYEGVAEDPWTPVVFARTLLPLVQVPPAGFRDDTRRAGWVLDPRPLPSAADAATLVLTRYLTAFGPASRRDAAAWAGVPQRDFAPGWERLDTVAHRDEHGTELLDLPGLPLPPAETRPPPRLLGNWDQPLLAYAQRDRIIPPEVQPLKLTLSGDLTATVDGRVAASWTLERAGGSGRVTFTPHVDLSNAARAELRAEARHTARILEPEAPACEVAGI